VPAAIVRHSALREAFSKGRQSGSALLDAISQCFSATTHAALLTM
jgi:hypothetical protein